jgi:hypothetical protein
MDVNFHEVPLSHKTKWKWKERAIDPLWWLFWGTILRMKKHSFLLTCAAALLCSASFAQSAPATESGCDGWEGHIVVRNASAQDKAVACEGFARAHAFFASMGRYTKKPVIVEFRDRVELPSADHEGRQTKHQGLRVVGMYDPGSNVISMTSVNAKWLKQRPYFGLKHEPELVTSVMAHEIIHGLSKSFYTYDTKNAFHAQEEYIGYAGQLATMKEGVRNRVLAKNDGPENRFDHENSVNDLVHAVSPHKFGVMSYRHFVSAEGGKSFVDRIYSGDYQPISLSDLN